MADGSTFHFNTSRCVPFVDGLLDSGVVDKEIAGDNAAAAPAVFHFRKCLTSPFTQRNQRRICREKRALRIILEHYFVLIVETDLIADDNVKNFESVRHCAGNTNVYDAVCFKLVHDSRRANSSVHLANAAADKNNLLPTDCALIKYGSEQGRFGCDGHLVAN